MPLAIVEKFTGSPALMAKLECCNFIGGGCISDGPDWKEGECILRKRGKRCSYFERAVLPLAKRLTKYADVPGVYYERAAKIEGVSADAVLQNIEEVRRCGCGSPLKPRHRYCVKCTRDRRRATMTSAMRKRRLKMPEPV